MEIDLQRLKSSRLIVIDANGDLAKENRCFDPEIVKEKWYRYSGVNLYQVCLAAGFQLVTKDIFCYAGKKSSLQMLTTDLLFKGYWN